MNQIPGNIVDIDCVMRLVISVNGNNLKFVLIFHYFWKVLIWLMALCAAMLIVWAVGRGGEVSLV